MWRAGAAARAADGYFAQFCREAPVDPVKAGRSSWLMNSLAEVGRAERRAADAERMWERLLFGPGGSEPAELVKAEEARLDAAHALAMTGLRFAVFARAHRLEACRWEIRSEEHTCALR